MKSILQKISIGLFLVSLNSCVTTSDSTNATGDTSVVKSESSVLVAAGFSQPQMAPKSQADFRADTSSKNPAVRMKALLATGQEKLAIQDARDFLRKNPNDLLGLEIMALGHALMKDFQQASYYANRLISLQESHASAWNILGMATVLEKSAGYDKYRRAIQHFQKSYDYGHRAAGLNLAEVYLLTGNAQQAQPIYQAITASCSKCVSAHIGAGIAANRLNQYAVAKGSFEKALRLAPGHEKALYHLALTERNGFQNLAGAAKHLEQLIADSSDLGAKERAQALLRQIKGEVPASDRVAANKEGAEIKSQQKRNDPKSTPSELSMPVEGSEDAEMMLIEANSEEATSEEAPE
jgi:tetratricopeptide (TPR) repeat protein